MVIDQMQTTVGYFCPVCGTGVISMVGAFQLNGDMMRLKCPCHNSALTITMAHGGEQIILESPCFVCPGTHRYQIRRETCYSTDLLCLPCSVSGVDTCFIGKKEQVCKAMDETEQQLLQTLQQAGLDIAPNERLTDVAARELHMERGPYAGDGNFDHSVNFDDNHIMDMISFVLKDMMEAGDITCRCEKGKGDYEIIPTKDGFTVHCKHCNAARTVPCNSSLSAEAFLESTSLHLE